MKTSQSITIVTGIAGILFASSSVQAQITIFQDDFSDNSAVSDYSGPSVTHNAVDGSMTVDPNSNGALIKTFSGVTLGSTGDYLELTLDLDLANYSPGGVRYGFFTSDGSGYAANIGTPPNSNTGGSDFVEGAFGVNTAGATQIASMSSVSTGIDSDVPQSLLVRIERNASNTLDLSASWSTSNNGTSPTSISHTLITSDTLLFNFDRIGFVGNDGDSDFDYDLDNITVVSNVPEPSALALLGLVGMCMFIRRRRG